VATSGHPDAPNGHRKTARSSSSGKSLPHNVDAEASILGGLILKNELLALLATLEIRDFYHFPHQVVFEAIRNLEAAKQPIDVTTLEVEIEKRGKLDAVGGAGAPLLGELALKVPTVDNVLAYTKIVRDHAMLRRLALKSAEITERAYGWEYEADELLGDAIAGLETVRREYLEAGDDVPLISVGGALEELHHLASLPVYPTPFPALNAAIGFDGMIATQAYVLVSGTGGGKTTIAAEIAKFTAANGGDALIATYEMFPAYYVAKMAAGELSVSSNDILRERVRASEIMGSIPKRIHFLKRPSLATIRKAIEKIKRSGRRAPLLVVDYLQALAAIVASQMERPDPRAANDLVSRELLRIAEECEVPLLAISATSRSNSDKLAEDVRSLAPKALVGSAKESSQIEYDAAAVIVTSTSDETDMDGSIATVSVAKARFGETCHIDARFDGARGRWQVFERVAHVPKSKGKSIDEAASSHAKAVREAIARVIKTNGPMGRRRRSGTSSAARRALSSPSSTR
jgi:replicative DNA helicase